MLSINIITFLYYNIKTIYIEYPHYNGYEYNARDFYENQHSSQT